MTSSELKKLKKNWDLLKHPVGYIAHDWAEDGVRCIVLRGPSSWNAYMGVPLNHPAAGFSYEDLPIRCHCGLTFAGKGLLGAPAGYYWYGFDFSHAGDLSDYHMLSTSLVGRPMKDKSRYKPWTADMVKVELVEALWDFKKVVRLLEK